MIPLALLDCELPLDQVYLGIDFDGDLARNYRRITYIRRHPLQQEIDDQLRRLDRDRNLRVRCARRQMGGMQNIRQPDQRMIGWRRLLLIDIERRARHFPALQRRRQVGRIDQRAARRVDDADAFFSSSRSFQP